MEVKKTKTPEYNPKYSGDTRDEVAIEHGVLRVPSLLLLMQDLIQSLRYHWKDVNTHD